MSVLDDELATYLRAIGETSLVEKYWAIESETLDDELGQLGNAVSPSYLPFATRSHEVLAVHLWPGRATLESPVVWIARDTQRIRYLCESIRSLPSALAILATGSAEDRRRILTMADAMAAHVQHGIRPSEGLRHVLLKTRTKNEPTFWHPDAEGPTTKAWSAPELQHPFVGVPKIPFETPADEALPIVKAFVASRPDTPELLALLLATQAEAGVPRDAGTARTVLHAEAWRHLDHIQEGVWRLAGQGIREWDVTLKQIEDPDAVLTGPLAALVGHPDTYSTDDPEGPDHLVAVADAFGAASDWRNRLIQLRNAAMVVGQLGGWDATQLSSDTVLEAMAETCDRIAPGSIAAEVARRTARALAAGL